MWMMIIIIMWYVNVCMYRNEWEKKKNNQEITAKMGNTVSVHSHKSRTYLFMWWKSHK